MSNLTVPRDLKQDMGNFYFPQSRCFPVYFSSSLCYDRETTQFRTSYKLSKELRQDICARAAADRLSARVLFLYGSKA